MEQIQFQQQTVVEVGCGRRNWEAATKPSILWTLQKTRHSGSKKNVFRMSRGALSCSVQWILRFGILSVEEDGEKEDQERSLSRLNDERGQYFLSRVLHVYEHVKQAGLPGAVKIQRRRCCQLGGLLGRRAPRAVNRRGHYEDVRLQGAPSLHPLCKHPPTNSCTRA